MTDAAPAAPTVASPATAPAGAAPLATAGVTETTAERKHRLKVNGQEREYAEKEVLSAAQRALAGEDRFTEAHRIRTEAEGRLAKLSPAQGRKALLALQEMGWTPDQLRQATEEHLLDAYAKEFGADGQPLSAEAKELQALREKEAKRAEEEKARAEDAKTAKQKAAEKQHADAYGAAFTAALAKHGITGPAAAMTAKRLAMLEEANLSNAARGHPLKTADDLVAQEVKIFAAEVQTRVGALEGDALLESLGPALTRKVLQAALAKGKKTPAPPVVAKPAGDRARNQATGQFVPVEREGVRILKPSYAVRDVEDVTNRAR